MELKVRSETRRILERGVYREDVRPDRHLYRPLDFGKGAVIRVHYSRIPSKRMDRDHRGMAEGRPGVPGVPEVPTGGVLTNDRGSSNEDRIS
jgi:hypothetical protein